MANGTLAASQFEMLSQSGTGIITVVPPATNTNQTLTLPDATGTVATLGTTLTLATAVSASGTAVDFTSIPSWVKRIRILLAGVSTNGSNPPQILIGDSGGFETSGYAGTNHIIGSGLVAVNISAGFVFGVNSVNWGAVAVAHGGFTLEKITGNNWVCSGAIGTSNAPVHYLTHGSKELSDTLTQVRITTVNGTDSFDAGTINIMYEG